MAAAVVVLCGLGGGYWQMRREARRTVVRAKVDGVPMTYDVYVLNKNGCTYDFVYLAPQRAFDDGVGAFERFARGFETRVPRDR